MWLAGLPRPARPLHRQKLLKREIILTESPDQHLVWHESRIFVKPIPDFLLSYDYWENELCTNEELYKCACGLLLSYAWLVCHKSDFGIAKETGLLSEEIPWTWWTAFVRDILGNIDTSTLHQVNKRYQYGELRLSRLNSLYRYTPSVFSVEHLVYGFMSSSTWYRAFFERNFAWLLAIFAYITVVLSAMQVGLATEKLQANVQFQGASYGFAITSMIALAVTFMVVLLVWMILIFYHFSSTIQYSRRVEKERAKKMDNRA